MKKYISATDSLLSFNDSEDQSIESQIKSYDTLDDFQINRSRKM